MAPKKDISGHTYGYLKAVRCTGEKENGSYLWEFECTCGNHIVRRIGLVTGGKIVSCGCHKARNLTTKSLPEKFGQFFGTNVSRITSKKPQSNTSSGHRGVSLHHQEGRNDTWIAYIYFQGTRFYLGSFSDKQDAIKARESAEKHIFGDFLNWYIQASKQDRQEYREKVKKHLSDADGEE